MSFWIDLAHVAAAQPAELEPLLAVLEENDRGVWGGLVVDLDEQRAVFVFARELARLLALELDDGGRDAGQDALLNLAADGQLVALDEQTVAGPVGLLEHLTMLGLLRRSRPELVDGKLAGELVGTVVALADEHDLHLDLLVDWDGDRPVGVFTMPRFYALVFAQGGRGRQEDEFLYELAGRIERNRYDVELDRIAELADNDSDAVPFAALLAEARDSGYVLVGSDSRCRLVLVAG
jgi:hypothetical protein